MKKILASVIFLLAFFASWASHVPGGNITYECLGNNQYLVRLTLYRDCSGIDILSTTETVDIANSCGINSITSVTLNNVTPPSPDNQISQLCPSASSTCDGGAYPGFEMYIFEGIVTLNDQCDSWTFSYGLCCRNSSDNITGATLDDFYVESTLNNLDAPCNSSPAIQSEFPVSSVCLGQVVCLSLGIFEQDGNSLTFEFVQALGGPGDPLNYAAGYTGTSPIPGVTIDPSTGQITFVANSLGLFVFAVLITETDVNGNVVGTIIHEFQVSVIQCVNQVFDCNSTGSVSNVVGAVTQTGPTELEMCEGVSFSFDMSFEDPDIGDSVFINSNIAAILPGAVVSYSYPNTPNANVIQMSVSWTPPPGSANSNNFFTVTVSDNSCPVSGAQTIVYNMNVLGSTNAGPDVTICKGSAVDLFVANGNVFNWSVISGEPIQIGSNFSCNPCDNPTVSPIITTTYEVVSDLTGSCVNRDTITVNVVPDFTYTLSQSSASSCLNSEIQLDVTPDLPGNYSYEWSPAAYLDATNISNPVMSPTSPGNFEYAVEIVSQDGCVKNDTIAVYVANAVAPIATVTTNLTNIMCGDTIFFDVDLGCGVASINGTGGANTACGTPNQQVSGVSCGGNTSTSYPAPFGNWYKNARHQFLFLASELQAAGFTGGQFDQISWQVLAINGTTQYNGYTIKMGVTGTSSLTTNWETGLSTVFGPQNKTIATGWNTFNFTSPFYWDGTSNIVVEVCFDNLAAASFTNNSITPWECKSFNASNYYLSDATPACNTTLSPTTSTNRPVTRFNGSLVTPDPSNFTFQWSSGNGLSPTGGQSAYAVPFETTDFELVVVNNNGGCTDTVITHIDVLCDTCQAPIPQLTNVTCFGGSDGEILATPVGIDGPPFDIVLMNPITLAVIQQDNSVVNNTTFSGLTAGSYLVRSYDTTGCWADTVVTLTEPPQMQLVVSSDTIVCIGGTAVLSASASGGNSTNYSYVWTGLAGATSTQNVSPTAVTTYDVYAEDPLGCISPTLNITVNMYPPILTTIGAPDTICPGFGGQVTVVPNGGFGGFYNYVWSDASGNTVGMSNVAQVTPTQSPATYYVVVTDGCETPAKIDSAKVYWYDVPQPLISADIVDGCYPIDVNFTNNTLPTMISSCLWSFGDGTNSTDCGNQLHTYGEAGVYDVSLTITSPDGCVGDTTYVAMIETYEYPKADFGIFPNPVNVFEPTAIMYDSSSSDVTSFEWYFGENGILGASAVQNPSFTFPDEEPENYDVTLIVTNQYGCKDTAESVVVVNGVYNFYVPSGFTPNGDGVNDEFFPKGEGVDPMDYEMYIFDRWGRKVFETSDATKTWNGTYLGLPAPEGVYVWKIITNDQYQDAQFENVGHVTLLR